MHRFIKAAGFPDFTGETGMFDFLEKEVIKPENLQNELNIEPGCVIREYCLMTNRAVGICAATLVASGRLPRLIYYYPFLETEEESSSAECILERHTETDTYSGIIDDLAPGISLIFHMTNSLEYRSLLTRGEDPLKAYRGTYLSAFANEGKVLLPVVHDTYGVMDGNGVMGGNGVMVGNNAMNGTAAFGGSGIGESSSIEEEAAIEEELYERIQTEDLYTVVDQTFIPWGVDCDQYSIVGEITGVEEAINAYTGVSLWFLKVTCNNVKFRLCMRKNDLLGEPLTGRRIKCGIWLHGRVTL